MNSLTAVMRLRSISALLLVLLAVMAMSACGFAPLRADDIAIRRLAMVGFEPQSPTAKAIARVLPAQVELTSDPTHADAVLRVLSDRLDRTVVATTATGEVREMRLRLRLRFQIEGPMPPASAQAQAPVLWLPVTELEQSRDTSYTETAALAKDAEQRSLVELMRQDLARALLLVLARVPVPIVAPAVPVMTPAAPSSAASSGVISDASSDAIAR